MKKFAHDRGSHSASHCPRLVALLLSICALSLVVVACGDSSDGILDLTGLPLSEAQAIAEKAGVDLVQEGEVPSFLPAGTVLAQDPLPGTDASIDTIQVTVSRDPIPVKVRDLRAYDPDGNAGENDNLLDNLIDGDLTTFWSTETTYRSPDFQGLGDKIGVGFSFWLEEGATMLKIDYTITGWEGEVQRISSNDLPIAIAQLGNKQQVSWTESLTSGRIWFTQLAPVPDSDRYGVFINEVTFYR